MNKQAVLATFLPLLLCTNGVAQELQQITWQATAIKYTQPTIDLVHAGQQPITALDQSSKALAVRVTSPEGGLSFQARTLTTTSGTPNVILNGKTLTHNYQPILATELYYLSYQHKGQQTAAVIEGGYELIAYWQS
ncbi:TPA: hypothetical protein RQM99_002401 [Aeromonas dhakensis]|uniref:hypothetical protein n=1 Tax=Aeromonas dhakensis TaxID=196024 RepID=UPI00288E5539|nr:hypothetical protein [Aeromonas dhakensis]